MTKVMKKIPVDTRKVDETTPSSSDYVAANVTGRQLKERILADPAGRAAYDRARSEIAQHQTSLSQLRKLRSLAQATVAESMGMDQSEISRLERRTDLLLSTLRRFIQATGGDLQLVAHFPEGDVELLFGEDIFGETLNPAESS